MKKKRTEQLVKEYQRKLNACSNCPHEDYEINWYDKEQGTGKLGLFVYPNSSASVFVVGQNPSHRRYKDTHAMNGRQGDLFREIFGLENLAFSNLIQISTLDNKVTHLTDDQIGHCFFHLLEEIQIIKPKIIILCSSFAANKIKTIPSLFARLLKAAPQTKIYFTKHPDYYLTYRKESIEYYRNLLLLIKRENIL